MSVIVISSDPKIDPYTLPVARARCDTCGALGPEVECRHPKRKNQLDDAALRLAREFSGFLVLLRCRKTGRKNELVEHLLCRSCAEKRLFQLQREYGQAIAATSGRLGAVLNLQWERRARILEAEKLRRYLGVGEFAQHPGTPAP